MTSDSLRDDSVMTYRCPVTPNALWLLRQLLTQWFTERRVAPEDVDDLVVIANELATSVVVHDCDDEITVRAQLRDGEACVEVAEHDTTSPPSAEETVLSEALGDALDVHVERGLTRLACRRRVSFIDLRP